MGPRTILVTGGSGFIGRHVVAALRAGGHTVTVADLQPHPDPAVPVVLGDLTEAGAVERAVADGTDAVVHLAARTSVLGSLQQPVETYRTNVSMTAELLERCRAVGVGVFVLASTNAVVGGGAGEALIDERSPLRPLTPYGATKAAAEMLVSASDAAFGVRGVSLRFTNVYGTGMAAKDSIVARMMRAAVSGDTFEVYGDGRQVRDYVYADDVVAAVQLALVTELHGPLVIGSGRSTSVLDLLALARHATGAVLPARHVPPKDGEMAGVRVDVARAGRRGWSSQVGLDEGLARVWAAWR